VAIVLPSTQGLASPVTTAPPEGPAIVARGLERRYHDAPALVGLDLEVAAGAVFGLVGPDGAGKTTTIRLLAGITRPTAGTATVLGRDVATEAERLRPQIGYMAQRFGLYGDLTVAENLDFFADAFGVRGAERAGHLARLLDFARLGPFRARRAAQLSGGMQKKLALACTLVHEPRLLFLDEPTTGVDPVSRREFWEILTDLHLAGITIFVATPYMDEAERCGQIGLLYAGQLVECNSPERVRARVGAGMLEVRVADQRSARGRLAAMPGVREVQTYGDRIHVLIDDPSGRADEVSAALMAAGHEVYGVRATRPRLEEAFISLIRARQAAASVGAGTGPTTGIHPSGERSAGHGA
jgi:ABC-2 type transport system ATP-binding protein